MWAVTFGTARRGLHWELQFLNPEKGPKSEKNDPIYQKAGYGPARGFSPVPVVIPVECLQREVCPRIVLASPVCHVLVHEMVVYLNDSRWQYRRLVLSFASTIAQTGGITVSTPRSYLVITSPKYSVPVQHLCNIRGLSDLASPISRDFYLYTRWAQPAPSENRGVLFYLYVYREAFRPKCFVVIAGGSGERKL